MPSREQPEAVVDDAVERGLVEGTFVDNEQGELVHRKARLERKLVTHVLHDKVGISLKMLVKD